MKSKRAKRSKPYLVVLHGGRTPHEVTRRQWDVYRLTGLIVLISEKQARLRDEHIRSALTDDGHLVLVDTHGDVSPCRTNSQVIDSLWPLADAGTLRLSREERQLEQRIREQFPLPEARDIIAEMRSRAREWRMRLQYGW